MTKTVFSLDDFPKDPFALKGSLFAFGTEDRIKASIGFIETYSNKEILYACQEFMDFVYLDCFRGNTREWNKHGGFPGIETTFQFDYSVKMALAGLYKSSFESLRTCIELTVLSVYYALDKNVLDDERMITATVEEIKATLQDEKKWVNSLERTPFFSSMLKLIGRDSRFKLFDEHSGWFAQLKKCYNDLSDYTHVKGYKKGTQYLNEPRTHFSSSTFHNVNLGTLNTYFDALVNTVQHLAILVSLYNPVVLAELPLEEKFGMNEPVGFIQPGQSQVIRRILPTAYQAYFLQLAQSDEEILSVIDWVNSRPSLTAEDWEQQIKAWNNLIAGNFTQDDSNL